MSELFPTNETLRYVLFPGRLSFNCNSTDLFLFLLLMLKRSEDSHSAKFLIGCYNELLSFSLRFSLENRESYF
jgi:hypothetical protein